MRGKIILISVNSPSCADIRRGHQSGCKFQKRTSSDATSIPKGQKAALPSLCSWRYRFLTHGYGRGALAQEENSGGTL